MVTRFRPEEPGIPGSVPNSVPRRLGAAAHGFARDESGVMIAFTVFFFLIILIVAGIGVDLMRFEMERTRLQNTLDRAVLAAADLENPLTPSDVVADYFDKAHVTDATLGQIHETTGLNYRMVDAQAQKNVPTQFIHMLGFDTLVAPAFSAAEEQIEGLEISLVLDVSGSMHGSRLGNLKPAAKDFVDFILAMTEPGDAAISLIPYATQVGAGKPLLDQYSTTHEHDYSHCIEFETADFDTPALSTSGTPRQKIMHFDPWSYFRSSTYPAPADALPYQACPTAAASQIRAMSTDATALKAQIDGLTAGGNTSIDVGMKWGAALLDPGTRPVINNLVASGDVPSLSLGKPVDYATPNARKVIVVMTDGQNTTEYNLRSDLRSGNSDVYYNPTTAEFSIRRDIPGTGIQYFWVNNSWNPNNPWATSPGSWNDHPKGAQPTETGSAVRLTYPALFAQVSLAELAWKIMGAEAFDLNGSAGQNQAWSDWYSTAMIGKWAQKNTKLDAICTAAKANGVVIYAIGFEAPVAGQNAMRSCASSPSHYFDASGVQISDVFQAIGNSIAMLRLTQ